ncbi:MAG: cation:proton antiporter [Thermoproteota archaeon]
MDQYQITGTFLAIGFIAIIGFLADLIFKKKNIPDIPILIFIGLLIGPILNLLDQELLFGAAPFFTALAITAILFDGGLKLDLDEIFGGAKAIPLAITAFILSGGLVYILATYMLDYIFPQNLFFAIVMGGTSSAVVIPLIEKISEKRINAKVSKEKIEDESSEKQDIMKSMNKIKSILNLESAITDVFVIVFSVTLLQIIAEGTKGGVLNQVLSGIASAFAIGIVLGVIGGIVWVRTLAISDVSGSSEQEKLRSYDDILTFTTAILLYGISEYVGGSGPLAALTFGFILGNGKQFASAVRMKKYVPAGEMIRKFQHEISFLLKTFFFIYIGVILPLSNLILFFYATIITIGLLLIRYVTVYITTNGPSKIEVTDEDRHIMSVMIPRGLAAAAVSQLPSTFGLDWQLAEIVGTIIFLTVIITSIASTYGTIGKLVPNIVTNIKKKISPNKKKMSPNKKKMSPNE